MTIEVRVPTRAELPAYYRVLPFANGLPSWEPAPAAWHGGSEPWPPMRPPATDEQLAQWAAQDADDPAFHPVAAVVDGAIVGGSAVISMEVTVPGGAFVPAAGVTATGVLATHRRRGALSSMMTAMLRAAAERGEPLALLSASEGAIYGRYGFLPATQRARWEIERSEAALRPADPAPGTLAIVDAATARAVWPALHTEVRRQRVGELSPQPGRWDSLSDDAAGTNGPLRYLIHRDETGDVDGIAHYRLPWSATADSAGTVVVEALEATSPAAYRAMWGLLLDLDLTRRVVAPARPRDEPLRWLLADPRAMRVTRQSDNLWARLLDVPAALEARRYEGAGSLVLRVADDAILPANNGTWQLAVTEGVGTCRRTDAEPAVDVDLAALSALYLGGGSAADLADAGRLRPRSPGALEELSRLLRTTREPHNAFGF